MDCSFVSKAKFALHNAAAKAERVLTEIKADLKAEFGKPDSFLVQGSEEKRELPGIDLKKKEGDEAHNFHHVLKHSKEFTEEAQQKALLDVKIPSSMLLRGLAAAIQGGRSFNNMKELQIAGKSDRESSHVAEWSGMVSGLAAMKRLSSREKDMKSPGNDANLHSIWSLFDADAQYSDAYILMNDLSQTAKCKIPEEIHGAPPGSFVARLAETMAGIKTKQKMGEFWLKVISELRHHWDEGRPIPCLPSDGTPDLRYCLLHQQLQVINCCIARKKRHAAALASLDALCELQGLTENSSLPDYGKLYTFFSSYGDSGYDESLPTRILFVKGKDGKLVLRLGADCPAANLRMLATGELVYSPITQEGPILTENLIKENEELVLRTGSLGAGCSQLLSDMQAFKAANPGCILEDFVRWYSPLDWRKSPQSESSIENLHTDNRKGNEKDAHGCLSARMQCQGNLWQELWASAKPIPAVKQARLYDEDLVGETTLNELYDIQPADLFEQLFIAIIGVGFAIAESASAVKNPVMVEQLQEYKSYIISTCSKDMSDEMLENLCQVYEAMETTLYSPPEELYAAFGLSAGIEEVTEVLEKSHRNYIKPVGTERNLFRRAQIQNYSYTKIENPSGILSRILEAKTSLFEKRLAKYSSEDCKRSNTLESDWTLI